MTDAAGWPGNAYVGQEVICIDATPVTNPWHRANPLVLGARYRIMVVHCAPRGKILFAVSPSAVAPCGSRPHWMSTHFRPAQSTDTGMAILRRLQNPQHHQIPEDA